MVLSLLFITFLSAVLLAVYEIANKVVGEASILVSLVAGVTIIALAAHCFQRRQRKQTEILVSKLRERERDLFKRLDKEIKIAEYSNNQPGWMVIYVNRGIDRNSSYLAGFQKMTEIFGVGEREFEVVCWALCPGFQVVAADWTTFPRPLWKNL